MCDFNDPEALSYRDRLLVGSIVKRVSARHLPEPDPNLNSECQMHKWVVGGGKQSATVVIHG